MYSIRKKDKSRYLHYGGKGVHNYCPAFFRTKAHASNYLRSRGLSEESWEIVRSFVFEVDENDKPIGALTYSKKFLDMFS